MTKADLALALQEKIGGLPPQQARELVTETFEVIKEALTSERQLKVSGFGVFEVRDKAPRLGRNPQTGAPMMLEARRVVTFKSSPVFRDLMNNER